MFQSNPDFDELAISPDEPFKSFLRRSVPPPLLQWYRELRQGKDPISQYPVTAELTFGDKRALLTVRDRLEWRQSLDPNYEKEFGQRFVEAIVAHPGANVAVIGAAQGRYVLAAAVNDANVFAFEPASEAFTLLRANIAMNKASISGKVALFPLIVSDAEGTEILYSSPQHFHVPSTQPAEIHRHTQAADCTTFDALVRNKTIPACDIVMMDIEGDELRALNGMGELLASEHKPRHFFVEMHPAMLQRRRQFSNQVHQTLRRFGYEAIWYQPRGTEVHVHYVDNKGLSTI